MRDEADDRSKEGFDEAHAGRVLLRLRRYLDAAASLLFHRYVVGNDDWRILESGSDDFAEHCVAALVLQDEAKQSQHTVCVIDDVRQGTSVIGQLVIGKGDRAEGEKQ